MVKPQQHISTTTVPEMGKAETPCSENPDAFYNEKAWPFIAKHYCDPCPLKNPCLEEAMRSEHASPWKGRWGLWGGLTPKQRGQLRWTP
jgi:hypothetical protein